jgi:glycosyltransferase involved in cell wall biosynthesis
LGTLNFFSVIIPNYNHGLYLKQRIDSVLGQTFTDFEIIILDDCSSDNSKSIIESYKSNPKISKVVYNQINSGSTFKQWQKGIELAKGNYIWIAESDDYCSVDFLETINRYILQSTKSLGLVYTQTIDVDENNEVILHRKDVTKDFVPNIWEHDFILSGHDFITNYLKVKNVIPNASAVVFRKSLISNTLFDKELLQMKMAGDWLFWIKLCEKSDIAFIAKELNFFRNHKLVSRNHNTAVKKINRVMEEKYIREYITTHIKVNQDEEWKTLYKLWFKNKAISSVFDRSFYKPKYSRMSIAKYLQLFYLSKFKKHH